MSTDVDLVVPSVADADDVVIVADVVHTSRAAAC